MKLMVTGGAGFIGTNFIKYIANNHPEDKILCFDKLTYAGKRENLAELEKSNVYEFIQGDICDKAAVERAIESFMPDCIVNFAAESHVDRSLESPEVFIDSNIKGTLTLLEAVNKYKIKRFHQVSTDEVYGDLPLDRPDLKFDENYPLVPSSPYSVSKASADMLVLAYYRSFKTPGTISRCSNNYGPYQHSEKLIPHMISLATKNKNLPVYGDGKNVRDWIFVDDHCRGIDMIIRKGVLGEVYNMGGGEELSNTEIVRQILELLGKPTSLITYVADRPGHDRRYAVDSTKITCELGWRAEVDFEDGLKATVEWYLNNLSY